MVGVLNVGTGYKKIVAAGMAGLGATIGALVLTGKLFAAFPLAGIGGFVISAPDIQGTTFSLTPSLTATDSQGGWPAAMISLGTVSIQDGFELTKNFDLTSTPIGALIPSADLNILSSTVSGQGLLLDSSGLQAATAHFDGFNAAEQYSVIGTNEQQRNGVESSVYLNAGTQAQGYGASSSTTLDPTQQLGLSASAIHLTGVAINTDALKTSSLDLGSLKLAIVANTASGNSYGDFTYDTTYDTAQPDPHAASTTSAPKAGAVVPGQLSSNADVTPVPYANTPQ